MRSSNKVVLVLVLIVALALSGFMLLRNFKESSPLVPDVVPNQQAPIKSVEALPPMQSISTSTRSDKKDVPSTAPLVDKKTKEVEMQAPNVVLNSPPDGAIISSDKYGIAANAYDNVSVVKMELYINDKLRQSFEYPQPSTAAHLLLIWDLATTPNGIYSVAVKAYDAAGNVGSSPVARVTIAR